MLEICQKVYVILIYLDIQIQFSSALSAVFFFWKSLKQQVLLEEVFQPIVAEKTTFFQ